MTKGGKPPITPLPPGTTHRPGVSARHERYIGRVTVAWSWLEATMQDVLWQLLDGPIDDGRIITAGADANRKIQWLQGFANKHLAGDELREMTEIFAAIDAARIDRNFIQHGSWGTLMPDAVPIAGSIKEKGDDPTEIVAETFPEERMRALWNNIHRCKFALMRWANRHAKNRGKTLPYPPDQFRL
jgi:hypothetical protein